MLLKNTDAVDGIKKLNLPNKKLDRFKSVCNISNALN